MSLYISSRQYKKSDLTQRQDAPILIEPPQLRLQHRIFEAGYDFSNLLLDSFELVNSEAEEIAYPMLPYGGPQIIFLFGGVPLQTCLCGPTSRLRKLSVPAQSTAYCARFRAGTAGWFIQQEAGELADAAVPLRRFSGLFSQRIVRAESFHERNVMLGRQLAALDADQYAPLPLITSSIDLVMQRHGGVKVSELARAGVCSERYINRIFHAWVGFSPKCFCELTQLHFAIRTIVQQMPKSLMKTAVACGYYDQTHMNRSFRKFLGYTADDMRCIDGSHINLQRVPSVFEGL